MPTSRKRKLSGIQRPRTMLAFDCPWTGHQADEAFRLINSQNAAWIGKLCKKCNAVMYFKVGEVSPVVGPAGESLPASLPDAS